MRDGFVGNTPITFHGSGQPEGTLGGGPDNRLDAAGKAGKALLKALDSLSFDANIFAYYVATQCRGALRKRLMSVVYAIINILSDTYDNGDMDDETTNAKRLKDTIALYHMEG